MRRLKPEERYRQNVRHEQRTLEEYLAFEYEWANDILRWYQVKGKEIPEDQYRAAAFFINREYRRKPGSLTLLYATHRRCQRELPECTKENAFDQLCYKYKLYAEVLKQGGYD